MSGNLLTFFCQIQRLLHCVIGLLLAAVLASAGYAQPVERDAAWVRSPQAATGMRSCPCIALIIDDLGAGRAAGARVIALHGPVALAVLPATPAGTALARMAHAHGKEVLLHQPLQPLNPAIDPGPQAITVDMNQAQLHRVLTRNLAALPHAVGVNTHMGSRVTGLTLHMHWFMQVLQEHPDAFFIDSFTTQKSQALASAWAYGIPALRRDVFLDNDRSPAAIELQFALLKRMARRDGYALGIGHPYPSTMSFLEWALPRLKEEGIQLISLREMLVLSERFAHVRAPGLPKLGGHSEPRDALTAPAAVLLSRVDSAAGP